MNNLFDVSGKVALITGSAGGLGLQMASALARADATIALCDIDEVRLQDAHAQISELGATCKAYVCNLANQENIHRLVADVMADFGRIDILINNAGVSAAVPAIKYTDETWRKVLTVNLDAYYYLATDVAEHMKEAGGGRIINIASMHAEIEMAPTCWPLTAYCTSKGAVKEMTRALAVDLAPYNINVNAIGPGYFQGTEMTKGVDTSKRFNEALPYVCPKGRMGQAGELDGVVLLLASDASSYLTGQLILVDGGWSCT